jgi:hypothetical protein
MSADTWFEGRPGELRGIYDAVARHLHRLGPVHIEAVGVGFLIKRKRTIAELRPRQVGFALSFIVRRELHHERLTRRLPLPKGQVCHFVVLERSADVDAQVRASLTEAFATAEAPKSA